MLKVNPPLKITLLTLSYLFLLSACGGGGGGGAIPDKDKTPPVISSKSPDAREIDVDIFKSFTITFNENINTVTENNIVLLKYQTINPNSFDENLQAIDRVKITVSTNNNKLVINPVPGVSSGFVEFTSESRYKLTLLNIEDSNGNPMAETTWEFATTTIPSVNSVLPLKDETVSQASDVTITFSEAMDQTSLESGFSLEDLGLIGAANPPAPIKIQGISMVYVDSTNTATFKLPDGAPLLNANSIYRITLSNAKDLKGNIAPTSNTTFNTNNVATNTELKTQPSAVIATAHSDRVDINWTAAPAISGASQFTYNVYVSTDNVSYKLLTNTGSITVLNYSDSNVTPNTAYYYAITANANSLESKKVFNGSGAVTPLALIDYASTDKPTTVLGNMSITVSWNSLTGAQTYNLYVDINNTGTFTLLNKSPVSTNLNNFVHNSDSTNLVSAALAVVSGNTYAYKVAAINGNRDEGAKSSASLIAKPVALPEIISFTVNPADILTRQSSTLTAEFANGTGTVSVAGKPDIILGTVSNTPQTFKKIVSPATTTSYTLSVSNSNGDSATPITKQVIVSDPGIISFKFLATEVSEVDTTIMLSVERSSPGGRVSVEYKTNGNGTASSGLDYLQILPTTITFIPGQTQKLISINIVDDNIPKEFPSEFFTVSLFNPSNGAVIDPNKNLHKIVIIDNDILSFNFTAKQLNLKWDSYPNATLYKLFEKKNGGGFVEIGQFTSTSHSIAYSSIFKNAWVEASYLISACIVACVDSNEVSTLNQELNAIGLFQASNTANFSQYGAAVALSSNGNTLVVGAWGENTGAVGNESGSGAAYVYIRNTNSGIWSEQVFLKASNPGSGYFYGYSLALSSDGNTLVVGAPRESATLLGVNQIEVGAVYVYKRTGKAWNEVAKLQASNPDYRDNFGYSVSVNGLGNIIAVGSIYEDGSADGSGSGPQDNTIASVGAVYMFNIDNLGVWKQQAYVKSYSTAGISLFGTSVSLSDSGNHLAVGADSGIGAAYVFFASGTRWAQGAFLRSSNPGSTNDRFGNSVTLSGDGATLAVGAYGDASNTTGVDNPTNNTIINGGAVYVFKAANSASWSQQAYIKPGEISEFDWFGTSVALSFDGNTLAVGDVKEDSSTVGINSLPNESSKDAGAVYVYTRSLTNTPVWAQQFYIKDKANTGGQFGSSVALTRDGNSLAVGARFSESVFLY